VNSRRPLAVFLLPQAAEIDKTEGNFLWPRFSGTRASLPLTRDLLMADPLNPIRNLLVIWIVIVVQGFEPSFAQDNTHRTNLVGRVIGGLSASSLDGTSIEIEKSKIQPITVVCFLGNDCPMAKLYVNRLNEIARRLANDRQQKVSFIGINSNPQDSLDSVRGFVKEFGVEFPFVKDDSQKLMQQFGATRTPEVFVLDESLRVRYHGRVDDQYAPGVKKSAATRNDLEIAIEELLAGKDVTVSETEFLGCLIGKAQRVSSDESPLTFRDAAVVLNRHCTECHRDNDIAPFALVNYEDLRGWADMIVEVVDSGRMPPWHANPEHGEFVNARLMPEEDKQVLRDWLAAGTPRGELNDLPAPPEPSTGWNLPRQPDLIVPMSTRPFIVPKTGTVDYQYYVADPGLKEGRWIVGAEIIPGNRNVVHHSIVFIRPPDGEDVAGLGWLAAYVPGQRPSPYPPGHGRWIPAGSKFVFQQHYTPNGVEQADTTQIGLIFAESHEIDHQIYTLMGINQEFEIPPHAKSHEVAGRIPYLSRQGRLLGISPHMHYRGSAFQLVGHSENGSEVLLDVPRYDFNWQHLYELKSPRPLSDFQRIDFTCTFDNSEANRANPDPTQLVTWGDQSWEEMAVVYMDVSEPLDRQPSPEEQTRRVAVRDPDAHYSAREREMARAFVDDFFARFDPQGTGKIPLSSLPEAMRRFGGLDTNGDKMITRDEVEQQARLRFEWFEERQQLREQR
jgi:peroxiredoxin